MKLPRARILLIGDDRATHLLLRRILSAEGCHVERVPCNAETLQPARSLRPDIVLLDLDRPHGRARALIQKIRGFSLAPIIVLSESGDLADKLHAFGAGAVDYITKPFFNAELIARAGVALRHRQGPEPQNQLIRLPGMDVDIGMRRALVDGAAVELTLRETNLLALLALNAGQVLTHGQLLSAVWGPAHIAKLQYLRVYIKTLRQKLGRAGDLIRTHVGTGYSLSDGK